MPRNMRCQIYELLKGLSIVMKTDSVKAIMRKISPYARKKP